MNQKYLLLVLLMLYSEKVEASGPNYISIWRKTDCGAR